MKGFCSPGAQCMPGGVNIGVEVLLRRLSRAGSITRVIVGEDVTVDACAEANVKATHLPQIHSITMREQHCVPAETNMSPLLQINMFYI